MSYAVETKKRKFDRILESLSDHASPSRPIHATRHDTSIVGLVPQEGTDSAKKRRVTLNASRQHAHAPAISLATHYLPSDRKAFLTRLETFRPVTKWHIPSTESINAAAWAKRGWLCHDTDTVSCGSCKERLFVQLDEGSAGSRNHIPAGKEEADDDDDDDGVTATAEIRTALIKKFEAEIVEAHSQSCPWRRRGCDASIQRIEGLLNAPTALSDLRARYDSITAEGADVPQVESLPANDEGTNLAVFGFEDESSLNTHALVLAISGWQRRDTDVLECRHCFRSLGLWLYRGVEPPMERLDAVESHLDYCPWRSADAQNTEIAVGTRHEGSDPGLKERVAGWALVYKAMAADNIRRGRFSTKLQGAGEGARLLDQGHVTPEQRERKMKDLLKRIKDIKKPFNVKGLLKRKERMKA